MEPLSISHSQELFTSAGFGPLDELSDEIIRRCAGLPQAIITISGVLASQRESNTVWNLQQIQNSLPANTTSDDILKQVLNVCYNCLPGSLQTCLLFLSLYPENYMILKEDIVKQWVAEGFILAPTENDKMKVAGSYFDTLVSMGLIQHIDVDYGDELLYYAVHHTIHDLITSKSTEQNFITVIDYSQRTVRFSNKVRRLSLQFGSATYATTPDSIGLSLVRSLAFIGLKSCFPPILEFKLLRFLTLHMWADQPSTGVDLKPTSELFLLRSLQVTCNDKVHLPDLMQGPKHLETLEINAVVAAIPANIVHLRSWLHLRLGVGTELPDVTGILKSVRLNPPISLDESSSPPNSVTTIELLIPICSVPKWIGQLINLYSLKIVVKELDDISNLQELPFLTILSLHVQRRTTELISFATGAFAALKYFEFRCGVLRLIFQKGTMPNLQSLKLGFNAHRGEQHGCSLVGIEDLLNVQKISGVIGVTTGAKKHDFEAAESTFKKAMGMHSSKVSIRRADMVDQEFDRPEEHHSIRGQLPSTSSEQPGSPNQESQDVRGLPEKQYSIRGEHPSASSEQPESQKQESQEEECSPPDKQHSVREKQQVEALGRVSFSSIRTPRSLLEVDLPSSGEGSHDQNKSSVRSLEEEPIVAARVTVEDAFGLLLKVDDVDRLLQSKQADDNSFQLRRRRQVLLEGLAASLELVDPFEPSKSAHSSDLAPKDDIVFLRIVSLPKGRKLLARYLRLVVPGSELTRIVCMAIFRHLRFLFGGLPSEASAAETTVALAKTVSSCVDHMELSHLSACLAAVVCSSEQPPLRPLGSSAGDGASLIIKSVLDRATELLTGQKTVSSYTPSSRALWQASFDAFFGLLTKYCLSKYESILQMFDMQASDLVIGTEASRATGREIPFELIRACLPHTNEQQRQTLLNFAQRITPAEADGLSIYTPALPTSH